MKKSHLSLCFIQIQLRDSCEFSHKDICFIRFISYSSTEWRGHSHCQNLYFSFRKMYYLKLCISKLHATKPATIKWSTTIFEYSWKNSNSSTFLCLIESAISVYCGNTFIRISRDQMLIMKTKQNWIILRIDPDTLELQSTLQILFYENVLRAQMYRPLGSNYP